MAERIKHMEQLHINDVIVALYDLREEILLKADAVCRLCQRPPEYWELLDKARGVALAIERLQSKFGEEA